MPTEKTREELNKDRIIKICKEVFETGLTVAEINQIIATLQDTLSRIGVKININPQPEKIEETVNNPEETK